MRSTRSALGLLVFTVTLSLSALAAADVAPDAAPEVPPSSGCHCVVGASPRAEGSAAPWALGLGALGLIGVRSARSRASRRGDRER